MKILPTFLTIAALLLTGCKKEAATTPAKTNETASGNPITAPVDYLGAVAKAKKFSEKTIDTTSLNQAIQLFYANEDHFPKDLNEVVAKHYVSAIPTPPQGMRWDYNPKTGEIKMVPQ